jgi:hypothetical protein
MTITRTEGEDVSPRGHPAPGRAAERRTGSSTPEGAAEDVDTAAPAGAAITAPLPGSAARRNRKAERRSHLVREPADAFAWARLLR